MSLEQKRIINQFIAEFGFDPFSLPGRQDKLREAAAAAERGCDPITITRLATLVDKETKQILEDSLSLIEQIKYMVGIAERGTGKKCPADERPEIFLLDYVKSLEAALARQDALVLPQGATLAGWLREWEGDDSDLGQWLFAATEEDKDDSPNWRPVYWLKAAPTSPAQDTQA